MIQAVREQSTGIWADTEQLKHRLDQYLEEDIYTSPQFRINQVNALAIQRVRLDS